VCNVVYLPVEELPWLSEFGDLPDGPMSARGYVMGMVN
jgi:hypothetical protein